jgi:hypothetical protein
MIVCRAISCLAMYFLPQTCEFLKVQGRNVQNFLHVPPLGIINDRLRLTGEAVNMTRPMIVRIGDKQNAQNLREPTQSG